ncbi:MAG: hypothetical protein AAF797_02120 [Planctomycetota bacterium]
MNLALQSLLSLSASTITALAFANASAEPLYTQDFEDGQTTFRLGNNQSGGTAENVVDPNNPENRVARLSDVSPSGQPGHSNSPFFLDLDASTKVVQEINRVLALPFTHEPVAFYFRYDLERQQASDGPKSARASLEYIGEDRPTRFPTGEPFILGDDKVIDAYNTDGELDRVDHTTDAVREPGAHPFAGYRFTVIPSGGVDSITRLAIRFQVRVDTDASAEVMLVDNIEIGRVSDAD